MSYNFVDEASSIRTSTLCAYDTSRGYESDFNENGDVDGWDYFDFIHTYGAWDGFLFGTLYGSYALIGRTSVFPPVSAETHYTLKIIMKINPSERVGSQVLPTTGRVMWVTTSNPVWGSDKQMDFAINADNMWHTYSLNMGIEQWWQGDIRNLRIYPVYEDGRDGDEFFIKTIKITSTDTFWCLKPTCSYYPFYSHPCGGIGTRGYCRSSSTGAEEYTIEAGVNDELIVDINDYGNEIVKLDEISGATGEEISKIITKSISKVGVGGYAETEVEYTEANEFKIYSGTYVSDSTAAIKYSNAAVTFGFFDSNGNDLSSKYTGSTPASKFKPASSFKIKSFQLLSLFTDNSLSLKFDPTLYNIEGGRRDWFEGGMGSSEVSHGDSSTNTRLKVTRTAFIIDNADKTIIDFSHPFNASGRIKKISLMCTLDQGYDESINNPGENFAGRLEATSCKIKIFRPKRDGTLKTITSVDIPNRDYSDGKLLSTTQESTQIACDIWVNKGDLIGIYNANMYLGKSISGAEADALYYHVDGEATGEFDPGRLNGDGIGGLLVYARSDDVQKRLSIDVDFGHRINVEEINVIGSTESRSLEFNIARCLDINWSVDLFGGIHFTGHVYKKETSFYYNKQIVFLHTNEAYGIECLSDGILTPPDGLAADSYSISPTTLNDSALFNDASSPGITVTNPRYFFCNGDGEWLGVYNNIGGFADSAWVEQFDEDPIAFTLLFPHGTTKKIYKSKVYFKERYNFRNFALSVSYNLNNINGDADDPRFHLIEEFAAVTLDNRRIEKDGPGYEQVNHYLFSNPSNGQPVVIQYKPPQRVPEGGWAGYLDNYEQHIQSTNLDWNVISHEFDAIECKGFRFYCDYHKSTKINEMELYCQTEDVGSSMISSVDILHSHYNDLWWTTSLIENADSSVTAFVGDTSRYFSIEIEPVNVIKLNNIRFDIKKDSVYVGKKGCKFQLLPVHSKLDAVNQAQSIDIKNIYGDGFDLYVDIAKDSEYSEGLVFYSRLNNTSSITNPEVGADARYHKEEDYQLVNYNKNCAINNECYGLRNLIDGKTAYYSRSGGGWWNTFESTLTHGTSIDFSNDPGITSKTIINIPTISRNRYWKLGFYAEDHPTAKVTEMLVFKDDEELDVVYYYDKNLNFETGPISDSVAHMRNQSTTGSYYELKYNNYIGFDLGESETVDKIELYHYPEIGYDPAVESNGVNTGVGIDKFTVLALKHGNAKGATDIYDYSYYEHEVTVNGTGVYTDFGTYIATISGTVLACASGTGDFLTMGYDNWSKVANYGSTFTCSGTVHTFHLAGGTSGWHRYDCSYIPTPNRQAITNETAFVLDFKIKITDNNEASVSVGMCKEHSSFTSGGYFYPNSYLKGVSVVLQQYASKLIFFLVVVDLSGTFTINTGLGSEIIFGTEYYCRLQSDGNGNYYSKVWTDTWDGASLVTNLSVSTSKIWKTNRVGIFYTGTGGVGKYIDGELSYFSLNASRTVYNQIYDSSIRFEGGDTNYLSVPVPDNNMFMFNVAFFPNSTTAAEFYVDFRVKFNSFPSGQHMLIGNWNPSVPFTDANYSGNDCSWAFVMNGSNMEYWFYDESGIDGIRKKFTEGGTFYTDTWYSIMVFSGKDESYLHVNIDSWEETGGNTENMGTVVRDVGWDNLIIGQGLDGWITELRISKGIRTGQCQRAYGGYKVASNMGHPYGYISQSITYERLYMMSLYVSDDNFIYGKYCDLDLVDESYFFYGDYFNNSNAYWYDDNYYNVSYHTYFAIDLGKRYDLDILRSYGTSGALSISTTSRNISFSSDDISDVTNVNFEIIPDKLVMNDDFTGANGDLPNEDRWYVSSAVTEDAVTIYNNKLQMSLDSSADTWLECVSTYGLRGDFDIQVDWSRDNDYGSDRYDYFWVSFPSGDSGDTYIYMRPGRHGNPFTWRMYTYLYDNGSYTSGDSYHNPGNELLNTKLRIVREGNTFRTYYYDGGWILHFIGVAGDTYGKDASHVAFYKGCSAATLTYTTYFDNFTINEGTVIQRGNANDARWVRVNMYNADDTTRTLRKIGIYPDISTRVRPGDGGYNHEWDSLGKSITFYGAEENVAFNTTVSGSYFGMQYTGKMVNGVIPVNTEFGIVTLNDVWCSETESNPWITVDLGEIYEIYRIKIYHGYDGEDTDYLITDYTVRTSTDGQSFTTRFTITSNSSFERTHDLSSAINARYVKIDITGFNSGPVHLRTDNEGGVDVFNGATLREIEIYEAYSFESVNSEEYPIICINLRDQFYLESHSIIGFDVEDSSADWSNADSNFCYSDFVLDNPSKIDFRDWGEAPVYDQWAAVKMDTATNYNSGPHYLKHARIESVTGQNPCEYPWWWSSNISTLSRDYDYHVTNSVSAIRIDYPATDVSETISFYEGDNFGVDEYAAFRDGFNFRIRIDDIDNLDMSYGYFYFGGYDSTDGYNSVIHKWHFSTLSGVLDTGWTDLFLRLKDADEIDYTVPTDESILDVRIPNTITFGTIGVVFRGIGNPLTMHLDGFYIRRNHFNDYVAYGSGLYLTGRDYLVCPIGEFDLSLGTIEFWLRSDFDNNNYDFYNTLKNRAIFQFSNNANDVFGLMSTFNGLEIYSGNINEQLNTFTLTDLGVSLLDVSFHLGIVFSNDGTQIDNDGSTIKIYFNNSLMAKSNIAWNVYDNKHFQFVLGGQGPLSLRTDGWTVTSSVDAVVCNLKIYNYCKTNFESSIFNRVDGADALIKPSNLIEISKNNLTYYKVGDSSLPLKFEAVSADAVTSIYVRTDVPSSLVGKEKRTSNLLVYWDMAI